MTNMKRHVLQYIILGFFIGLFSPSIEKFRTLFKLSDNDEDRTVAKQLAAKVRVLCWIMTSPHNHRLKAKHVKATWGRRCNKLIFMSSQQDPVLGSVKLNVSEGRHNLWAKTKQAFEYVYDYHVHEADWFVKADDDTFMIIENLRLLLNEHSPADPIWFGRKISAHVKQGYNSGGAGYVLSKEALKRFIGNGINNGTNCRQENDGDEDLEMGKCMENLGVIAGDSRDKQGNEQFFPLRPQDHLIPGNDCHEMNVNYLGNNLNDGAKTKLPSATRCQKLCQQTKDCAAFTWVSKNVPVGTFQGRERECWLKHIKENRTQENYLVSGPKICSLFSMRQTWHQVNSFYPDPRKSGLSTCSDTAISFHYVSPTNMYVFEYLIYYLKP